MPVPRRLPVGLRLLRERRPFLGRRRKFRRRAGSPPRRRRLPARRSGIRTKWLLQWLLGDRIAEREAT